MARSKKSDPPQPVIIHPRLYPLVFFEEGVNNLFYLWRHNKIRPQSCRPMARCILKMFQEMGLANELLGKWGYWLCDPSRVDMHTVEASSPVDATDELQRKITGVPVLIAPGDELDTFVSEF